MKALRPWLLAAFASSSLLIATAPAAVDMFLEIDGIQGESTDDDHEGEIEILNFSWGATRLPARSQQRPGGKVDIRDFSLVKGIDAASPKLAIACASGEIIPEIVFTVRYQLDPPPGIQRPEEEFLIVTLTNAVVSSVNQKAGAGDQTDPLEIIVLNFDHIEIEYTPIGPDGEPGEPIVVGYDVKRGKVDVDE